MIKTIILIASTICLAVAAIGTAMGLLTAGYMLGTFIIKLVTG
jgi:hypothetical protein